jgi:methylphosphotriester-DNA--protein-cysteine methyltransferase
MTVSTPVLILNNGDPTAVYHGPTCRVVTHEHPHEPWMQTTQAAAVSVHGKRACRRCGGR